MIRQNLKIYTYHVHCDSGVAIGAALIYLNNKYSKYIKISDNPYLGPSYPKLNLSDLKKNFNSRKFKIYKLNKNFDSIADQLNQNKILAIYKGRSEFGPRALGNRSIISKPYPGM